MATSFLSIASGAVRWPFFRDADRAIYKYLVNEDSAMSHAGLSGMADVLRSLCQFQAHDPHDDVPEALGTGGGVVCRIWSPREVRRFDETTGRLEVLITTSLKFWARGDSIGNAVVDLVMASGIAQSMLLRTQTPDAQGSEWPEYANDAAGGNLLNVALSDWAHLRAANGNPSGVVTQVMMMSWAHSEDY